MISSAQRQVCLLTSNKGSGREGPQCRQLKANAQVSMNSKLGDVAAKFRAYQTVYVSQMERNAQFVSQRVSNIPQVLLEGEKKENLDAEKRLAMTEYTHGHVNIEEQLRAEREQAIFKIASSVVELKTILEHMHSLTIEQGSMLDRIDTHIMQATVWAERGTRHVERRAEAQKDFFFRKLILLALVSLILILFFYLITR